MTKSLDPNRSFIYLLQLTAYERVVILISLVRMNFRLYDIFALFNDPSREVALLSISHEIQKIITQLTIEMDQFDYELYDEATSIGASPAHILQHDQLKTMIAEIINEVKSHQCMAAHRQ